MYFKHVFSFSTELTYLSITDSPETCRLFRAHHFMHGYSSKYNFTDTLYHIIGTLSRTLFGTIFGTIPTTFFGIVPIEINGPF